MRKYRKMGLITYIKEYENHIFLLIDNETKNMIVSLCSIWSFIKYTEWYLHFLLNPNNVEVMPISLWWHIAERFLVNHLDTGNIQYSGLLVY